MKKSFPSLTYAHRYQCATLYVKICINFVEVILISKDFHTVKGYEMINAANKLLTPSMEDYLEMIYRCSLKNTYIRLNQVAQMLNVKDSSASKMMQKLGSLSLIKYQRYGLIVLTDKGTEIGAFLYERHNIIETFLKNLSQRNDVLTETELMEHVIKSETVEDLKIFNNFLKQNPAIHQKYLTFRNNIKNT